MSGKNRIGSDEIRERASTARQSDGLIIRDSVIEGVLDLSGIALTCPIAFIGCCVEQKIILRGASLDSLFISNCEIAEIDGARLQVRSDFQLCNGTHLIGAVTLDQSRIEGSLSCAGAFLEGGDFALTADSSTIGRHVIFGNSFRSVGTINLQRARIGGMLYCSHGRFENPGGIALAADRASIGSNLIMSNGFKARGEVSLRDAHVRGQLYCAHGAFENPSGVALSAERIRIDGRAFLGEWFNAKGAVRLYDAKIEGDLYCVGGIFQNASGDALDAQRIEIGGSVRMNQRFLAQGIVRLDQATIAGTLNCTGGRFENRGGVALSAQGVAIGHDVILGSGFRAEGTVRLDRAMIRGSLACENAICDKITTAGAELGFPAIEVNLMTCETCEKLRDESIRLVTEYMKANDELRQASKDSPDYGRLVREVKAASGRSSHATDLWWRHQKDSHHGRFSA